MRFAIIIAVALATSLHADNVPPQQNWLLMNMQQSYREVEYNIQWSNADDQTCRRSHIPTVDHRIEEIRAADCRNYCDSWKTKDQRICVELSKEPLSNSNVWDDAICVQSVQDLKNLCVKDDDCSSVENMVQDSQKWDSLVIGFLNNYGCLTHDNTPVDYATEVWVKELEKKHECDFGVGAAIKESSHENIHGLYQRSHTRCNKQGDPQHQVDEHECETYEKIANLDENHHYDGETQYRFGHHEKCGWMVQKYEFYHEDMNETHSAWKNAACTDRPEMIHDVFAEQPKDLATVCQLFADNNWCKDDVIGFACIDTCHGCSSIDLHFYETALQNASFAVEQEPWSAHPKSSSHILAQIDELASGHYEGMIKERSPAYHHRRLFELKDSLDRLTNRKRRLHPEQKTRIDTILVDRLSNDQYDNLGFYDAMATGEDNCASRWDSQEEHDFEAKSHTFLEDGQREVYDLTTLNDISDLNVSLTCPDESADKFYPIYGKYCSRTNVDTINQNPEFAAVVDARCQNRCWDPEYTGNQIAFGETGIVWNETNFFEANDDRFAYCNGLGDEFVENVYGLCAPYEECEQLCAMHPDCHSFEMHRFKTLCYLNTKECDSDQADILHHDEWTLYVRANVNTNQMDGEVTSDTHFQSSHWSGSLRTPNFMAYYPYADGSLTQGDRIARGKYQVQTGKRLASGISFEAVTLDSLSEPFLFNDPSDYSPLQFELNELIDSLHNDGANNNRSMHGTTAMCQYLCSRSPSCHGFDASIGSGCPSYQESPDDLACFGSSCHFFDHTSFALENVDDVRDIPFHSVHIKMEPECSAHVTGASPTEANGEYHLERDVHTEHYFADRDFSNVDESAIFIKDDSSWSLGLMRQTRQYDTHICGWNLQANDEAHSNQITWCEDNHIGAVHVYEFLGEENSDGEHAEEWACDALKTTYSCADAYMMAVCPKTCENPTEHSDVRNPEVKYFGDHMYSDLYCGMDNSIALAQLVDDSSIAGTFNDWNGSLLQGSQAWSSLQSQVSTPSCDALVSSFQNDGEMVYPCFAGSSVTLGSYDMSKLLWAFCPSSCRVVHSTCSNLARSHTNHDTFAAQCPFVEFLHEYDEAHAEGADRRMDPVDYNVDHGNHRHHWHFNQNYDTLRHGYSVSNQNTQLTYAVVNTAWNRQSSSWTPHYRNFPIDSAFSCRDHTTTVQLRLDLDNAAWHNWQIKTDNVTVKPICAKPRECPPYTTCVYSEYAFILALQQASVSSDPSYLPRAWVTDARAIGSFSQDYPEPNLMRQAGHTWVELSNIGQDGVTIELLDYSQEMSRFVLSDAEWVGAEDSHGLKYWDLFSRVKDGRPQYWSTRSGESKIVEVPQSDIIRVHDGAAVVNLFTRKTPIMRDLSDEELQTRVRMVQVGVDGFVDLSSPASIFKIHDHELEFKVPVDGTIDYVVVIDEDECKKNNGAPHFCDPDPERATCTNVFADQPACACNNGFIMQQTEAKRAFGDFRCVRPSHDPKDMDFLIRMTPATGVKHGLRVKHIQVCSHDSKGEAVCEHGLNDNIWVSGSFPSYQDNECLPENIFKNDDSSWCSERMEYDWNEVWIEFLWDGKKDFDHIKIEQEDNHHAVSFLIELSLASGYVDSVKCGYEGDRVSGYKRGEHERCPPLASWTSRGVDTRTTIGEAETLIEGELVQPLLAVDNFGTHGSKWDHSDDLTEDSMSKLRCLALAMDMFGLGAEIWTYLDINGMKHCQVQRAPNHNGYYGVDRVKAQHWTSGEVPTFAHFFVIDQQRHAQQTATIKPDTYFDLTLHGVSFQHTDRMKIKILRADQDCHEKIPSEVEGIGCTGNAETGFPFCNKTPEKETATRNQATFSRLKIQQKENSMHYKVCACVTADCFHQSKWRKVFGDLHVPKSDYTWSARLGDHAATHEIPRKISVANGHVQNTLFTMLIQRPLWILDSSNPADWQVKVVRERFGCNVDHDMVKLSCNYTSLAGYASRDHTHCTASADHLVSAQLDDAIEINFWTHLEYEDVGPYLVCFRNGGEGQFKPIPSFDDELTLKIAAIPQDRKHPSGIFHNQLFSAVSGATNPIHVQGTSIPMPSSSRIALRKFAKGDNINCGDNTKWDFTPCEDVDCDYVEDDVRPRFLPQFSTPSSQTSGVLGHDSTISLKFSEDLSQSGGGFFLIPRNGGVEQTIAESYNVRTQLDVDMFSNSRHSDYYINSYRSSDSDFTTSNPIFYFTVDPSMIKNDTLIFTPFMDAHRPLFEWDSYEQKVVFLGWDQSTLVSMSWTDELRSGISKRSGISGLRSETYHLRTNGEGMVEDVNGNKMLPINTFDSPFHWIIEATVGTSPHPRVLRADKLDGAILLHMNGPVLIKPNPQTFQVTVCGEDQDCTRDDEAQYHYDEDIVGCDFINADTDADNLPCDHTGQQLRRRNQVILRLRDGFPEQGIRIHMGSNVMQNSQAEANEDIDLHFDHSDSNRFHHRHSFGIAKGAADNLMFNVPLHKSVKYANRDEEDNVAHEYSVCYCNDQDDFTPRQPNRPDADFFVRWTDNHMCESSSSYGSPTRMLAKWQSHQCTAKCNEGCSGPDCHCDGNSEDMNDHDRLCLPVEKCWEACTDHNIFNVEWKEASNHSTCIGIDVKKTQDNVCYLIFGQDPEANAFNLHNQKDNDCVLLEDENMMHGHKVAGTPCTDPNDYKEFAGKLFVTDRVQIGLDFVFTPDQPNSIEIIHANDADLTFDPNRKPGCTNLRALNFDSRANVDDDSCVFEDAYRNLDEEIKKPKMEKLVEATLSRDRVMIIDCKGTCGVSSPANAVRMPEDVNKMEVWNNKIALNYFMDAPHTALNGSEATYDGPEMPVVTRHTYTSNPGFCDGNLDIRTTSILVGSPMTLSEYRGCHHPESPGFVHMDDRGTSNALCAKEGEYAGDFQNVMEELCDRLGEDVCESFDLRNDGMRGYLNGPGCNGNQVQLSTPGIMGYSHHTREYEVEPRRLEHRHTDIWPYSWRQMLRFHNIRFNSGGTFKVCFCDQTMLDHHACTTEADYKIEVGKIHVSGISCLLQDSRFRKKTCRPHLFGGLSCFTGDAPALDAPALDHVAVKQFIPTSEVPDSIHDMYCSIDGERGDNRKCSWLVQDEP